MSRYKTQKRLKRYWREEGNPRLKGLFLAGLDHTDVRPKEVGEVWLTDPNERERQLSANDSHRALTAPVSQQYSPGAHGTLQERPESGVARQLARDEFSKEDDWKAFLAGDETMDKDQYIKRALLNDSVTELDVLFREELETTFIMGAQPRKIFRDAANVRNVTKRKGDVPRLTDQVYAEVDGGQGSETGTGREGFDTVAYETQRVSQGFEISDALMAESEPDSFEALARKTGAAVENTINRICLVTLVDNANQSFDADVGGTTDATATQALNGAATEVDLQDLGEPGQVVVHSEFEKDIFDDTNVVYANRSGETQPVQERLMGDIMGMTRWKASDGTYNNGGDTRTVTPSNTWGYNADGEYGAVAFVQDMFNLVVWQEFDMETKSYEDPIRDLQGQNVRSWVDAVYGQQDAAAYIQY